LWLNFLRGEWFGDRVLYGQYIGRPSALQDPEFALDFRYVVK